MKKIQESKRRTGGTLKVYEMNDNNKNAVSLINELSKKMEISSILVEETVELEMQSFGKKVYSLNEFFNDYDVIKAFSSDLSFTANGLYNGVSISVGFMEERPYITLSTVNDDIELESLLNDEIRLDDKYFITQDGILFKNSSGIYYDLDENCNWKINEFWNAFCNNNSNYNEISKTDAQNLIESLDPRQR